MGVRGREKRSLSPGPPAPSLTTARTSMGGQGRAAPPTAAGLSRRSSLSAGGRAGGRRRGGCQGNRAWRAAAWITWVARIAPRRHHELGRKCRAVSGAGERWPCVLILVLWAGRGQGSLGRGQGVRVARSPACHWPFVVQRAEARQGTPGCPFG